MEETDDYEKPGPCLMDGDYCMDTTECSEEEYIPYSFRLLMEQWEREKKKY